MIAAENQSQTSSQYAAMQQAKKRSTYKRGTRSSAKRQARPLDVGGIPPARESVLTKADFRYYKEDFRLDKNIS